MHSYNTCSFLSKNIKHPFSYRDTEIFGYVTHSKVPTAIIGTQSYHVCLYLGACTLTLFHILYRSYHF